VCPIDGNTVYCEWFGHKRDRILGTGQTVDWPEPDVGIWAKHEWVRPEVGLAAKWKPADLRLSITSFAGLRAIASRQQQTPHTLLDWHECQKLKG